MSDFQTVFFVYQIKGFSVLLSKNFLKKINLRVRFLPLKIAFFEGFENDNILSSKLYTVTKSGISPQQKLGTSKKFKTQVHKIGLDHQIIFRKDVCMHTHESVINAHAHNNV